MSQSITFPPRLRKGDTVAVVSPSGPVPQKRLDVSLPILAERYNLRVGDGVCSRTGYLAGSDARRADEFNAALADPDVRAIFIARGGYGAMRTIPMLDAARLAADPIPIVGFSDATAILGWAWAAANVASIHGPVAAQLAEIPRADVDWMFDLLENPRPEVSAMRADVEGTLWGGNLSLLAHLCGSPSFPDPPEEGLLFFEDVGERPYEIDRYLTSLHQRGALATTRAALVGDLTRCEETIYSDHPSAEEVIRERFASFGIACHFIGGFGHGEANRALVVGARAAVDASAGIVELLDGAVS